MDADERLRREIAADLVHAIRFAMSVNADLADLADSRIVRTIATLEAERRRLAEQPKPVARPTFGARWRKKLA
jgi:hypothetical protein